MSDSESLSDDSLVPSWNVLKSKKYVQTKVDQRLKQLQDGSAVKSGSYGLATRYNAARSRSSFSFVI